MACFSAKHIYDQICFIFIYILLYVYLILNTFALGLLGTSITAKDCENSIICAELTESIVNSLFSFSVYVNYSLDSKKQASLFFRFKFKANLRTV